MDVPVWAIINYASEEIPGTALEGYINDMAEEILRLRAERHDLYSVLRAIRDTDWSDDPEWARDYATEVCVKMEKTSVSGAGKTPNESRTPKAGES